MSVDSRPTTRFSRRAKKDDEHLDYSEPDFTGWAAKIDSFVDSRTVVPATPPDTSGVPDALVSGAVDPLATDAPVSAERRSLESVLQNLLGFDGALAVALVDSDSGMVLGTAGSGVNIELAAAGASEILRARLASTRALGLNEQIDDLLISLTSQVQIIHPLPTNPSIFTYLIADKARASLAMARYKATEADLQIQL